MSDRGSALAGDVRAFCARLDGSSKGSMAFAALRGPLEFRIAIERTNSWSSSSKISSEVNSRWPIMPSERKRGLSSGVSGI